jgi:hypothetical protein
VKENLVNRFKKLNPKKEIVIIYVNGRVEVEELGGS